MTTCNVPLSYTFKSRLPNLQLELRLDLPASFRSKSADQALLCFFFGHLRFSLFPRLAAGRIEASDVREVSPEAIQHGRRRGWRKAFETARDGERHEGVRSSDVELA